MSDKAKRALIQIAGIEIEVFQLPNGDYVMSQTQVAEAIELSEIGFRRFLKENRLNHLPGKGFSFDKFSISGTGRQINAIPVDIASDFWMSQAFKGNIKAQALVSACMQEALQRRCDAVFSIVKSEQQYERQAINSRVSWEESRLFCTDAQSAFQNSCIRYKFNAAMAHDAITVAVCGKTASDLKEMELISGASDIGLNHVSEVQLLVRIAKMKFEFSRYRKGGISERVNRALKTTEHSLYQRTQKNCHKP
ncbi:hypothetical protein [Nostoc sp. TCL240-02]|uniref:hypothetical protein n=1 Tax=Nostoc sp. TCL240-02 TaxID=2572090 RepID=UPI00157FA55D|nr:hypothetical protein [Nostoc sp. TCL240-02]QKQ76460.1 hypothetical protein FBB35_27035 [Nostoc sp. TCL240-02]